jgi:soluble lytic murein transglycosylase-like protein
MNKKVFAAFVLLGGSLSVALPCAHADIYKFVDGKGVTHFTNIPPQKSGAHYKLYMREGKSASAVSAFGGGSKPLSGNANRERFSPMIDTAAKWYGMDQNLLHAVVMAESSYNPNALSSSGAVGLMQLMPATAKRYRVVNIHDPVENVHGGARYLRDLLKLFKGDMRLAVAAYNAGENAVIKNGNAVPPYSETLGYVAKVLSSYHSLKNTTAKNTASQPRMVAQITASP